MERFSGVIAAVLILAYMAAAMWVICRRRTLGGCIGAAVAFLLGGRIIVPAAEAGAVLIGWAIIACIVAAVIRAIFST